MYKKILIIVCFLIIALSGCKSDAGIVSQSDSSAVISYNPELTPFEFNALKCEEEYLQSQSDEDLKELCDQLMIFPWKDKQHREMVLKYYPIFFIKFNESEAEGTTGFGFDPYYEIYVYVYKAEEIGGLIPIYNEYKEKAKNKYEYAKIVYGWVLKLDNITTEEYDFLFDEAYSLYWTARESVKIYDTADENKEAFLKVLNAFGCVNDICKAMEKEIETNVWEDMQEYMAYYENIMRKFNS